jgi:hypothetical protein
MGTSGGFVLGEAVAEPAPAAAFLSGNRYGAARSFIIPTPTFLMLGRADPDHHRSFFLAGSRSVVHLTVFRHFFLGPLKHALFIISAARANEPYLFRSQRQIDCALGFCYGLALGRGLSS